MPAYRAGKPFVLSELDGRAALYAAANAARELNWALWTALPKILVADLVVADYRSRDGRAGHMWEHSRRVRGVAALAQRSYIGLGLTALELNAAIDRSSGPEPPQVAKLLSRLDTAAAAQGHSSKDERRAEQAKRLLRFGPTTNAWVP